MKNSIRAVFLICPAKESSRIRDNIRVNRLATASQSVLNCSRADTRSSHKSIDDDACAFGSGWLAFLLQTGPAVSGVPALAYRGKPSTWMFTGASAMMAPVMRSLYLEYPTQGECK